MKNILKFALVACVGLTLSSCLKDKDFDEDKVGLNPASIIDKPIIEIVNGGVGNFSKHVLSVDLGKAQDTNTFKVSYNDKGLTAPEDINVTFAYDAGALNSYNLANPTTQFEKLPDSTFSLPKNSVLIKKGQKLSDAVNLIIFTAKVDPSKLYLLPISITNTSIGNGNISGNNAVIYFHIIGNVLAGRYSVVGTRYNYAGVVNYNGGPIPTASNTAAIPTLKTISAISQTRSFTFYANLGAGTGRDYIFTYNPAVSTTALSVTFSASFLAGISNVRIITATYDPALKKITLVSTYNNQLGGAGDDRIVVETLTKI